MSVKLPTEQNLEIQSLKRGYTGSSETTFVKLPHCWKSHITAHFMIYVRIQRWGRIEGPDP